MDSWKWRFLQYHCILLQYHWHWGKAAHVGVGVGSVCVLVREGPQPLFCGSQRITSCVLPYTFYLILLRVSPKIQN